MEKFYRRIGLDINRFVRDFDEEKVAVHKKTVLHSATDSTISK